jgi:hypothetical protein
MAIKLPEQDVDPFQRETILPPLQVKFSILTLAPDDPKESFLRLLLQEDANHLSRALEEPLPQLPLVTWVFGRGRFLPPVSMIDSRTAEEKKLDKTTPELILEENAHYICGRCSCEVKRDNPGADLLFAMSWDALIVGEYIVDKELPSPFAATASVVQSIGQPEPPPSVKPSEPAVQCEPYFSPPPKATVTEVAASSQPEDLEEPSELSLFPGLFVGLGVLGMIFLAITGFLLLRSSNG